MTIKPYRPNVGVALFNARGEVLIARRFRDDGPEVIAPGLEWQMPQGGIDGAEEPRVAVMRELWEETGVTQADYLAETEPGLQGDRVSGARKPATLEQARTILGIQGPEAS